MLQSGGLFRAALEASLTRAGALYANLDKLDAQITDMHNQRDALVATV